MKVLKKIGCVFFFMCDVEIWPGTDEHLNENLAKNSKKPKHVREHNFL